MLLNNEYTLINQIRFDLLFENEVKKLIVVKTDDIVDISFSIPGGKGKIRGRVDKIMCEFNSSLGRVGNSVSMKIDGSGEYCGDVRYIKPSQVLDLVILKTTDNIYNAVCSVDNEEQKVILVRVNEVGVFQYSSDGISWNDAGQGGQGLSAYECAVKLGYEGTEEEWLKSLKSDSAKINPYRVFENREEAIDEAPTVPDKSLVTVKDIDSTVLLYIRNTSGERDDSLPNEYDIPGYDFVGKLTINIGTPGPQGIQGEKGDTGADGKDGLKGDTGLTGQKGDPGERGEQGLPGIKGNPGVVGDDGIQGIQGEQGNPGKDGISFVIVDIFETTDEMKNSTDNKNGTMVAVVNGSLADVYLVDTLYIASEPKDFDGYKFILNILEATVVQGPEGPQGIQGVPGLKGDPGTAGRDGIIGADGKSPYVGDNGNWWIDTNDTGAYAGAYNETSKLISLYLEKQDDVTEYSQDDNIYFTETSSEYVSEIGSIKIPAGKYMIQVGVRLVQPENTHGNVTCNLYDLLNNTSFGHDFQDSIGHYSTDNDYMRFVFESFNLVTFTEETEFCIKITNTNLGSIKFTNVNICLVEVGRERIIDTPISRDFDNFIERRHDGLYGAKSDLQGLKGEDGIDGERGIEGPPGPKGENGIQGEQGPDGVDGVSFAISKNYSTVEEMKAGDNIEGSMVALLIETNAYIYLTIPGYTPVGENDFDGYKYLLNLLEATTIQGPTGKQGIQGIPGPAGKDGIYPSIGANGNWWIGTIDTGTAATGPQGPVGVGGDADSVCGYKIWVGIQTEYDAIVTKDPSTIYLIKE